MCGRERGEAMGDIMAAVILGVVICVFFALWILKSACDMMVYHDGVFKKWQGGIKEKKV